MKDTPGETGPPSSMARWSSSIRRFKIISHATKEYWLAALLYLLINIFVFHGGWYKYFCQTDSYAGNVYGRIDVLKAAERTTGKRVIALLGDSITEEGIDANLLANRLNHPVVNLALPGTSPLDWNHFLQSIDPDQKRFDRIVFTVVPQNVRTQAHDDGIQTMLPVASPFSMVKYLSTRKNGSRAAAEYYSAFDRIYAFRRDLRDLILTPSRWFELPHARKEKLEWIRTYAGQTYDVCSVRVKDNRVIYWGTIQDPGVRRLIRHNVNRISKLNWNAEAHGLTQPLKAIADSYATSKTQIIIVSVPFGPGHHTLKDSGAVARYLKELSALSDQRKIVHWDAFEEPYYQDCSNFFDYRHLNHKGRRIFTEWLAVQITGGR